MAGNWALEAIKDATSEPAQQAVAPATTVTPAQPDTGTSYWGRVKNIVMPSDQQLMEAKTRYMQLMDILRRTERAPASALQNAMGQGPYSSPGEAFKAGIKGQSTVGYQDIANDPRNLQWYENWRSQFNMTPGDPSTYGSNQSPEGRVGKMIANAVLPTGRQFRALIGTAGAFAGDLQTPIMFTPPGWVVKALEFARIPKALEIATELADKAPVLGSIARGMQTAARRGFTEPFFVDKSTLGINEAVESLQQAGVSKTIRDAVYNGEMTGEHLAAIPDGLKGMAMAANEDANLVNDMRVHLNNEQQGIKFDINSRSRVPIAAFGKFYTKDPVKARAFLQMLEHRVPQAIADGTWALDDKAAEYAGVLRGSPFTDEEMARIQAAPRPAIEYPPGKAPADIAKRAEILVESKKAGVSEKVTNAILDGTLDKAGIEKRFEPGPVRDMFTRFVETKPVVPSKPIEMRVGDIAANAIVPDPFTMDHFSALADAALQDADPILKDTYARALDVYSNLGGAFMARNAYYKNVFDGFARSLGLGHMERKFTNLGEYAKFIHDNALALRGKMVSDFTQASTDLEESLNRIGASQARTSEIKERLIELSQKGQVKILKAIDNGNDTGSLTATMRKAVRDSDNPGIRMAWNKYMQQVQQITSRRSTILSIVDMNDLSELAGKGRLLDENVPALLAQNEYKIKNAILHEDYFNKLVERHPDLIHALEEGEEGEKLEEGHVLVQSDILGKKFSVDKGLAPILKGFMRIQEGKPSDWAKVARGYVKFDWFLRYITLIPFPAWERKIICTESTLAMQALNPVDATRFIGKFPQAVKIWFAARKGDPEAIAIMRQFYEHGTFKSFVSAELGSLPGQVSKVPEAVGKIPIVGKPVGKYLAGMEEGAQGVHQIPRMAEWLTVKDKPAKWFTGQGFKDVFDWLNGHHITYGTMTGLEKGISRATFLTYRWQRFNIPLQLQMILQKPEFYANVDKLKQGIQDYRGAKSLPGYAPRYVKEGYPISEGQNGDEQTYDPVTNYWPGPEINKVMSVPAARQAFMEMLHPIAKVTSVVGLGYDFTTGEKVPDNPGRATKMLGVQMDPRAAYAIKQIRILNTANRLITGADDPFLTRLRYAIVGGGYSVDDKQMKRQFIAMAATRLKDLESGVKTASPPTKRDGTPNQSYNPKRAKQLMIEYGNLKKMVNEMR